MCDIAAQQPNLAWQHTQDQGKILGSVSKGAGQQRTSEAKFLTVFTWELDTLYNSRAKPFNLA